VEQSFEKQLHGITGVEQVETSAGGSAMRKLATARRHARATQSCCPSTSSCKSWSRTCLATGAGRWWPSTPSNGEVLAFVSKPTFDPNLFVDGIDSESWQMLNESIEKPLLNRALRGTYPPGSTYKPFMAWPRCKPASGRLTIVNDAGRGPLAAMCFAATVTTAWGQWTCTGPSCCRAMFTSTHWPMNSVWTPCTTS
jgi:penicillin-binding protein 2